MRVGISGWAVGNPMGLGRLSRISLLALAAARPSWELHVYLRTTDDLAALQQETDHPRQELPANLVPHYPRHNLNRIILEQLSLPRQFSELDLDAYLGLDFTLPGSPVAPREVVVLPDLLPFTQRRSVSLKALLLYRHGIRRSLERAQCVLCISRATLTALREVFPDYAGDARVAYPALSPTLWRYARDLTRDSRALQVRGTLNSLADPGPYLLAVGVKGRRKNTPLAVKLYEELVLSGDYKGSLVLVGGDGRFHTAQSERQLAHQPVGMPTRGSENNPAVYDLGRINDLELSRLYAHADLLVNLSSEEGFGYPVLEALAHGTPVLVTEGSSMAEIAGGGIAVTPLNQAECLKRLRSTLGALPLLRREATMLPVEQYSMARLGEELAAALSGAADITD